ncbi:MAG: hypothetical protein ACRDH2_19820, partial [Anaerolineales bacterium]
GYNPVDATYYMIARLLPIVAALALVAVRRHWRTLLPVCALLAYCTLMHAATHAEGRLSDPLQPFLLILIAGAASPLWKFIPQPTISFESAAPRAAPTALPAPHTQAAPTAAARATIQDALFLSLTLVLSFGLYLLRLGFYSDDWSFLGYLHTSADQLLPGLFNAINGPQVQMRPLQVLYFASLYKLFGLNPLGYHVVNGSILVVGVLMFYLALRELDLPRPLALAVPLVYALLPHYATVRFWIAANQVNLSLALYFLSLYADLRTVRAGPRSFWGWKALSLFSLVSSGLAYEVALPLFVLNSALVWFHARRLGGAATLKRWGRAAQAGLLASNVLTVGLIMLFKLKTTIRIGGQTSFVSYMYWIARRALSLNYDQYDYGFNL